MSKVTIEDLANAFLKWAYTYYHFDKVKPRYPSEVLYAIRVWLMDVRRNYSPELERAIHRELARKGGRASAKRRRGRGKKRPTKKLKKFPEG